MATVTPILRQQKKDRYGTCPIWLRISDRDRTRFISLGVKVKPADWNPRKGRVRKGHPNGDLINQLILQRVTEVEAEILRIKIKGTDPTATELKKALVTDRADDFFAFGRHHIEELGRRKNVARQKRLTSTLKKLADFAGEPLRFDRLTVELLSGFETYCLTVLGNKQSTAGSNLSDIRSLVKRAVREGRIEPSSDPFLRFSVKRGEEPDRAKLSWEEIQRIEALELKDGSLIWHVRNVFLFAFYGAGIRFADLITLQHKNIVVGENGLPERLVYRMGKTGKRQSLKLTGPALRILRHYFGGGSEGNLDDFIFPLLEGYDLSTPRKRHNAINSRNVVANKYLKMIAKRANVRSTVTMHIARHSFADLARAAGWKAYDIMQALRHKKFQQTQGYLASLDEEALDLLIEQLFDGRD